MKVLHELREQRWDDHRYYHQSRVNQSLHLLSALSFLVSYAFLLINPVVSALVGWFVAMVPRQVGHFVFEPKDYDGVNQATHEHKERIKVGYNLRRKVVLLALWGLSPVALMVQPDLFGLFQPHTNGSGFLYNLSLLWIGLGVGALLFRTVHLFFLYDITTGLVWFLKILTDPFHDLKMYYKSPFYLLRGQLLDPMPEVAARAEMDEHATEQGRA
ncbi:MAG: hypothetical protein ACLFRB_11320 [Thiohalorhabdus sp.]|uniref:hypothetical protein n=1 Tax=Thiohalorhabdus sp. TaxID=3094134 RepID=UPI003980E68C